MWKILFVIFLPLIGTTLGSGMVFFLNKNDPSWDRIFSLLAAGVMTAASVWSLILPGMELSENWGHFSFLPALTGVWTGYLMMIYLEKNAKVFLQYEESDPAEKKNIIMFLAVTLHNFPEGMAVGAAAVGVLSGNISYPAFFSLALGIALQNIPEGAILSMPMADRCSSKSVAFGIGTISGIVEPIGTALTILLAAAMIPALPFVLCFAAGAMLYVVVEELIPWDDTMNKSLRYMLAFPVGFTIMMTMDIALG